MTAFEFNARSEADTDRLGAAFAAVLQPSTVVALIGTLGAGKTRFVQAVAQALGVPADEVTSPTFVLVNEYPQARLPVYHFDAYRLRDDDEFQELGPDEYFQSGGVAFVEWADRVAASLPADHVRVDIEPQENGDRTFAVTGAGPQSAAFIDALASHAEDIAHG
ncbi:MAG: tRNA (adenosine(37)-N6)-threonylcarbamoyltransferase complex ATPase subunit type 1 TsaE [Planctomycetota bacterium]